MVQKEIKESKFVGKSPEFRSDGVAVWQNIDKNGKAYLAIKIVGMDTIYAYAFEKKDSRPSSSFKRGDEI